MRSTRFTALGLGVACALGVAFVSIGGDLTPPAGPVQPTGAVPLNAQDITFPHIITQPGSYILTSNLTVPADTTGIIIDADDVNLDLNGFTVVGLGGLVGEGVRIEPGRVGGGVSGGMVRGFPAGGVVGPGAMCTEVRGVSAKANGAAGIHVGDEARVKDSSATGNVGDGIRTGARGVVEGAKAKGNGGVGVAVGRGARVAGATASGNTGAGVSAGDDSSVKDVVSDGNGGAGVSVGNGAKVAGAKAAGNAGAGVSAGDGAEIEDSSATDNDGPGVSTGIGSKIKGATAKGNKGGGISSLGGAIAGSTATENEGYGFAGFGAAGFQGCYAGANRGPGFLLEGSGGSVLDCVATANVGHGIVTGANSLIRTNDCTGNLNPDDPASGIRIRFTGNRIDSNNCADNEYGIGRDEEADAFNIILRNTARGNVILNYELGGNTHGPIVNVGGVGDISLTPLADHPWANFEF